MERDSNLVMRFYEHARKWIQRLLLRQRQTSDKVLSSVRENLDQSSNLGLLREMIIEEFNGRVLDIVVRPNHTKVEYTDTNFVLSSLAMLLIDSTEHGGGVCGIKLYTSCTSSTATHREFSSSCSVSSTRSDR